MTKKWPARKQWAQFFKILSVKEKIVFLGFLLLFLAAFATLCLNIYYNKTTEVPTKGGIHIEGVVGQPRFVNPIYANSDIDRDLTQLIFSGLMKYNTELNIVPDLTETFHIEDDKVYTFTLKENLKWQDGNSITADDVIFTIKTIQNPDFKSPLQANWVGVDVEKVDDLTIRFILKKPYAAFLENCTVGILPQHIWQNIPPENFAFDSHNLDAIGSGLFQIKKIKEKNVQVTYITLSQNSLYYGKKPNIAEIKFLFFKDEESLIKAAKKGDVNGVSLTSAVSIEKEWENHLMSLPRYFAIFFNQQKSEVLKDEDVRLALNYATNKNDIVKQVLNIEDEELINQKVVDSPILPKIYGFELPENIYEFNPEKAKEILEEAGYKGEGTREKVIEKELAFSFKSKLATGSEGNEVTELQKCLSKYPDIYPDGTVSGYYGSKTAEAVSLFQEKYYKEILEPYGYTKGTGSVGSSTRAKLNELCFEQSNETLKLKITLITVDQPQMVQVAEIIKKQWEAVGAELEVQQYSLFQLEQNFIKPRDYDALLFGEVLGAIPDPFPFWHSSQKKDPGLNLAIYDNKKADAYLEDNRKAPDLETRASKLNSFQNILIEDLPSIFLYSPDFIYTTSKNLQGVDVKKITDPSKRFIGVEDWFIKTKRILK